MLHVLGSLNTAGVLQSGGQMAGVRFLKHNIRDDFDDLTDVARLYRIRAVPCFVFFIGGAQVRAVLTNNW